LRLFFIGADKVVTIYQYCSPADFYGWRAVFRRKVWYKNQRNPGSAKPAFLPFFVANAEKIRMPTFPQIQLASQLQLYYNKEY
jgi:hypothetical protein